jgi:hypothetical protein
MIKINILVKTSEGDFVSEYYLSDKKAEQVLNSPTNIVMIHDENGEWTGETINKSFIISTEKVKDIISPDYSRPTLNIPSQEAKEEGWKKVADLVDDTKEWLVKKGIIKNPVN